MKGCRQIARLMGPGIAGLAAVQVNLFVNSWLATSLGTGAVSWLDYAFRLMYMPIGLFGISIATAALPGISRHAALNDDTGVRHSVSSGLRMMLMLNVPATAGLAALATPIVKLIYEHGRFTPADTAATAGALMCYAPGLVGYSAVKLISPAFYALGSSRIPVMASAASVIVNVGLNLILVRVLGHRGLALGTAIAALVNGGVLFALLRRRLGASTAADCSRRWENRARVAGDGGRGARNGAMAARAAARRRRDGAGHPRLRRDRHGPARAGAQRAALARERVHGEPAHRGTIGVNAPPSFARFLLRVRTGAPFPRHQSAHHRQRRDVRGDELPASRRARRLVNLLGLRPAAVAARPGVAAVTYMFLHGSLAHIFFNMLALWMFGTELERMWGTPFFLRYYFATGIAAAFTTIAFSMAPMAMTARLYYTVTIGASGAIYGLLLAYGLTFPNRPIYIYFVFPIPAKYFVMIMGGIELLSSIGDSGSGIAHITHLGGLAAGYALLRGRRVRPIEEARYRYLRWKMERARKKFGVYSGGRKDDWDKHVH